MTDLPADGEVITETTGDDGLAVNPGAQLATRLQPGEIERLLEPFTISPVEWIRILLNAQDMPESDPDEMALGMLAQIVLAESPAEVMRAMTLERARELCGGRPGGRSNVYEFRGARPMASTFEDGPACYCIVNAFDMAESHPVRFTTGAKSVQMIIAKMQYEGWMPFKAALEIRAEPTRRGFHPLNLAFGI